LRPSLYEALYNDAVTVYDWEAWLRTWNREILARYDPTKYNAFVDPA